jgi:hypothetical protein
LKPTQAKIDSSVRYMRRFLASKDGQRFRELPIDTQILYIVGILICDDVGFISQDVLREAEDDVNIKYMASVIAGRVGLIKDPFGLDRYS